MIETETFDEIETEMTAAACLTRNVIVRIAVVQRMGILGRYHGDHQAP